MLPHRHFSRSPLRIIRVLAYPYYTRSVSVLVPLWLLLAVLGAYVCGLDAVLGPMLAVLGPMVVVLGCSWAHVGGPGPHLEPMLAVWNALGALWAVLGRSWGSCWRSWVALGLLRPVLGRSWGLSWRYWAALEAYVGGLGPLCWRSWAALEANVVENIKNMATLNMCLLPERVHNLRPWCRSWPALGYSVGGLKPLWGPMLGVLGRSWG